MAERRIQERRSGLDRRVRSIENFDEVVAIACPRVDLFSALGLMTRPRRFRDGSARRATDAWKVGEGEAARDSCTVEPGPTSTESQG